VRDGNRAFSLSVIAAVVAGLYLSSLYSYLLFHSLVEIVTIAMAFAIFMLAWNTQRYFSNGYLTMLGVGYACIAVIDLLHTLAYKGMGVFPGSGANLPTQLWIAARYLQAFTLLAAPLVMERRSNPQVLLGGFAAAVATLAALVYSGNFPDCFVEGEGLTPFKIASEYMITTLLCVAMILLYRKRESFDRRVFHLIVASIALTALSEMSFSAYISVYGFANLTGHFAKLAAFYLIYRAILVTGMREPFDLVFRDLRQAQEALSESRATLEEKVRERTADLRASEARFRSLIARVQTAIVLHDGQGRVIESNPLAQQLLGLTADQLLGLALVDPAWHFVREDGSAMAVAEYPVSGILATREPLRGYVAGIARPDRDDITWVLINGDPEYDAAGELQRVMISFVDITERRRLEQSVARVASFPVLNPQPVMEAELDGHVSFANPATQRLFPDLERRGPAHPWLHDWETLAAACRETGRSPPDREVEVDGRWYHQSMYFVPDQRRLRIYGFDVTVRKQTEVLLHRLNRELRAISNCNLALMRATDEVTLLRDICRIVCDEAGYRMAWVGYAEHDEAKTVRPVASAGADEGYLDQARIAWADTERGQGPSGTAIRGGLTVCIQDFATDPRVAPWRAEALRRGFRSAISLPLKDEGRGAFGVLNIYAAEIGAFTPDEIRLLEELAADLAFGIMALRDRTARRRAEDELRERERHAQSLLRLSRDLERSQTLPEVLHAAHEEVRNIMGYGNLWAYLLSDDRKYARAFAAGGPTSDTMMSDDGAATLTIAGDRMLEEIAAAKEIVIVEDAQTDARVNREIVTRMGNRTIVNVPIILFDRHLGSVGMGTFGDEGVRVPTEAEQRYLMALASHMAVAFDRIHLVSERVRAEQETRRINRELEQRVADRTARLEEANRELEAFAYSVSHDLRAPLRHIYAFLDLLKRKIASSLDDQGRHYMDVISDSARRMEVLIDDLLSFSRMGRKEMATTEIDLEALVREVAAEFEPETRNRAVQWRVAELPVVTGDRAMLRIALINLISNAVKFTRPRPQAVIEIGSQPAGEDEVVLFVRDNGVGFDMQYVDKLFGVFQRLHGPTEFEGTGIGLANVRRIVQRHGGRTWAEGKVDGGATFYLSLPKTAVS
jgi:PAS domain S-box-containing protein